MTPNRRRILAELVDERYGGPVLPPPRGQMPLTPDEEDYLERMRVLAELPLDEDEPA